MRSTTLEAARTAPRRGVLRGLGWVTWRQHRLALLGALLALGGFGAVLVVTGFAMHHAFATLGLRACGSIASRSCEAQLNIFRQQYQNLVDSLPQILTILPGLLGIFLGAPLVARELESGTYRFAWTQGRNRVRWIAAKLAILGVVLTGLALAFSLLFTWWYGPWLSITGRMNPAGAYEISGVVFAARTLFAFMLGALAGTLIRRTVPAMAATAAVWLAAVLPSLIYLRKLIEKPLTLLSTGAARTPLAIQISGGNNFSVGMDPPHTAWAISQWTQNAAGHHLSSSQLFDLLQQANMLPPAGPVSTNPTEPAGAATFPSWLAEHGYRLGVSFQPNGRFWHFQGVEAGAYVILALLCAAATVWWVRRRTA